MPAAAFFGPAAIVFLRGLPGTAPASDTADVDAAYAAADAARSDWGRATPTQRQQAILKLAELVAEHADDLVEAEVVNTGKIRSLTKSEELDVAVDQLRFFAGAARMFEGRAAGEYLDGFTSFVRREPIGVVGQVTPWSVTEFLLLHDSFPRSVRFCVDSLDDALHRISGCDRHHYANEAERLAGRLSSDLHYVTVREVFATGLHEYVDAIQSRLIEIGTAMNRTYCTWMEDEQSQSQSQSAA